MAQENRTRTEHVAVTHQLDSISPSPAHGSGAVVTTMVRWCDQVRVCHVRCPRCGRSDLRERGDDLICTRERHTIFRCVGCRKRLEELERSEKEQSAETARRRHWSPNYSRKWRLSRVCTRAGYWTRILSHDERYRSVELSPIPSTRSRMPIAVCVDSGCQRWKGAHRCW